MFRVDYLRKESVTMKVPKIIHQTWKDTVIPKEWVPYQEKVKALHPDWEYRLWTDNDNDRFIQEHYPDLFPIYQKYPKPVMKADVIRYAIMDKIGGFYLDLDYEMLKPFDLEGSVILPMSREKAMGDADDRIGNCILASEPGHVFWKAVIRDLIDDPFDIGTDEIDVEKATGPLLLTKVYFGRSWEDIVTPSRPLFHPPSPRKEKAYRAILDKGIAYGIHHAHGSWRQPQWKKFLKKVTGIN